MKDINKIHKKYLMEADPATAAPVGSPAPMTGGTPPPMDGGMGGTDPMAGGTPGQSTVPNQLPGDPAGAMKFTQLMQQVAGPKGFLWTTYAKNKTMFPQLCNELSQQIKQLADIRNSIDLTLSNLSKAITRNQQIDQGDDVDAQGN